jgi:hypothetical protein
MKETGTGNLSAFLEKISSLNFWQRLFAWSGIRRLSYVAFAEYRQILAALEELKKQLMLEQDSVKDLQHKNQNLSQSLTRDQMEILKKDQQIEQLRQKADQLQDQISLMKQQVVKMETGQSARDQEYRKNVIQLNEIKASLESEKRRIQEEEVTRERERLETMKNYWSRHEEEVEKTLRALCRRHVITYCEKVPFRGRPDNVIEICDQWIVFDAKAPANDDLSNFPKYLQTQAEAITKYTRFEQVRNEAFLVVPSNTLEHLPNQVFRMGDDIVYVVSLEAIEPILLVLNKIEQYEFAEQMSPEERDKVCRVLGKFTHATKRRIQIDQFFAGYFLDLLKQSGRDLPDDISEAIAQFEKAEKLNPTLDKRSKPVSMEELVSDFRRLRAME